MPNPNKGGCDGRCAFAHHPVVSSRVTQVVVDPACEEEAPESPSVPSRWALGAVIVIGIVILGGVGFSLYRLFCRGTT
jgi:hypothetical protein